MSPLSRFLRVSVLIVCLAALSGCGIIDYFLVEPPEDTPQELFEAGQQAMHDKSYSNAAECFVKLKDRYPFSPYTTQAELMLGDAYFLDKQWPSAVNSYKEFESLHPRHEQMPYVLFQIGVANFNQFSSIDRPQTNVAEALEYFHSLREQYPDSPYAQPAAEYIAKSRRHMADHELFVANFYWTNEQFGPAWHRYQYVVTNFPDLPEVAEYATRMSELSYYEYQKTKAEQSRQQEYGSWRQYFDWL